MSTTTDPLDAALAYAERGWSVLPIHTPDTHMKGGCSCLRATCESIGKHPRVMHGVHDASTDPNVIRRWWSRWEQANVGIATGKGLVVLDVDPRHGGDDSITELEENNGEILTLAARTGGGGYHLYLEGELPARNSFRHGLDLKAAGGFVVAPPSVHASGRCYAWLDPGEGVRVVPAWLVRLVRPTRLSPSPLDRPVAAGTPRRRRYVETAIERECLELAHTPDGNRNNALNAAAFSLVRFVSTGEADSKKLAHVLTIAARHAGLSEHEIQGTLASAFGARKVAS